jgi:hypothetical protein
MTIDKVTQALISQRGKNKGGDPRESKEALERLDRVFAVDRLSKASTNDLLKDLKWARGRRNNLAASIRIKLNELRDLDATLERIEAVLKGRGYPVKKER